MPPERSRITWDGGSVSAAWHHPAHGGVYLVLGHGAGGTLDTPDLVTYADELAQRGIGAVRFNFLYSEERRKAPDRQAVLEDCYRAVADQVGRRAQTLFLGGRSMGGRIASHIVASGTRAAGLVFLSYPLHPPGQPDRLRDKHLYTIKIPMLFLQGTRDAFAQPDLLQRTLARLPTATLHSIDGADHALRARGRAPADIMRELVGTSADWIAHASRPSGGGAD
ncbi:MAG TPA: alpha/beta family hydrolase [bacterium]|nr:alpha/beta family hydrolase [bacterium]